MKPKVLVIGNDGGVQNLFHKRGFEIEFDSAIHSSSKVDLICFTGGEDISPSLYNETPLFRTRINSKRDAVEIRAYEEHLNTPKVGICRGGQLLNVLSGGSMWQHVTNHDNAPHKMIDLFSKKELLVTSVHHQMMIPGVGSYLLGIAENITKEYHSPDEKRPIPECDPEVVWYPKTKSLCYQPHPEYHLPEKHRKVHEDYFFKLIDWAFF